MKALLVRTHASAWETDGVKTEFFTVIRLIMFRKKAEFVLGTTFYTCVT